MYVPYEKVEENFLATSKTAKMSVLYVDEEARGDFFVVVVENGQGSFNPYQTILMAN